MSASKVLTLNVEVEGVAQAKADLRDFVKAARRGGKAHTKAVIKALKRQAKAERNSHRQRKLQSKNTAKTLIDHLQKVEHTQQLQHKESRKRTKETLTRNRKIIDSIKGMVAGYVGLRTTSGLWSAGKDGARALALEKAFKATGRSAEDLDKLMAAMGHTVDRTTVTALSNMGHTFNFAAKEMEQFGKIARSAAVKTGQDTKFLLNSIVTGTARQSSMILDNLGILINVSDANDKYADKLGITADKLNDVQKRQAFVNEVMEQGNQIIADTPVDELSARLAQVDTALEEVLMTMKKIAAKRLLGPIAEAFTGKYFDDSGTKAEQALRQTLVLKGSKILLTDAIENKALTKETLAMIRDRVALVGDEKELFDTYMGMRGAPARRMAGQLLLDNIDRDINAATAITERLQEGVEFRKDDAANAKVLKKIEKERALAKRKARAKAKANAKKARAEARRAAARARRLATKILRDDLRTAAQWVVDQHAAVQKILFKRADEAKQKFDRDHNDRQSVLLREALALQSILDKSSELDAAARRRLRAKRDNSLSKLEPAGQAAFRETKDTNDTSAAQDAVASGGMLAFLNAQIDGADESKIRAIGDALHEGIVTPMSIAADAASGFGHAMADAAAASIFEGKSIKKATNDVLKQIARRATAMAIFEGAAALASLAIGDFKGAALHGKAAATYGIVAVVSGVGASATGGVFDGGSAQTPTAAGVNTPRTSTDGRVGGTIKNVFYISNNGLRNRREDQDFIFDLMNHNAGVEGGPSLDPRILPGSF